MEKHIENALRVGTIVELKMKLAALEKECEEATAKIIEQAEEIARLRKVTAPQQWKDERAAHERQRDEAQAKQTGWQRIAELAAEEIQAREAEVVRLREALDWAERQFSGIANGYGPSVTATGRAIAEDARTGVKQMRYALAAPTQPTPTEEPTT